MNVPTEIVEKLRQAVRVDRLADTAVKLIEVPSPTRSGGAVADRLAEVLRGDGFDVERPEAGWPEAPAVVTRLSSGHAGHTLQMNGHLDTVHLPFVSPRVDDGVLYGSGAADMKGGVAAMVEALRVLRDTEALQAGSVLLTAHDLHEFPWGDGSQVDALIDAGYLGDAVLLPEYVCDRLPVIGRGLAVLEVEVTRAGEPVHEVLGGIDQPNVIIAGAEVIRRFAELDQQLRQLTHPLAGRESIFVGQVNAGEIFNQSPVRLQLSGTRRWLPGTPVIDVQQQYEAILADVAEQNGVRVEGRFQLARDAFELDPHDPFIDAFQSAHQSVTGRQLPPGAKPFVDDGNAFVARGGIPAITHGPNAKGAHTVDEEVPVEELARVSLEYALTAVLFCDAS